MPRAVLSPYASLWLTAAALCLCGGLLFAVPPDTLGGWIDEDGFFEIASAVGWVLAALAALAVGARDGHWRLYGPGAVLLAAFAARELDWHKAFTTGSLYKFSYYLETPAPLVEKVLAGGALLTVLGALIYVTARYARPFACALWTRRPAAITLANGVVLLVFSKVVDRSVNIVKDDWHLAVPEWLARLQSAVEEPLEFCLPLFFLLALAQQAAHVRRRPEAS